MRETSADNPSARRRTTAMAAIMGLVALLAVAAAVIYSFWQTPPGFYDNGVLMLSQDASEYLSAIRQGMHGMLLYDDQYTTLPASPILMYPIYMLAGRLLAPLHVSPAVVFHLVHAVGAISLVAASWAFVRTFAPRQSIYAYALILFGGSLAVLPIMIGGASALLLYLPGELGPIQALLFSPHESLGLAAAALSMVAYCRASGWSRLLALAVTLSLLGLTYPFILPVLLATIAIDMLWAQATARWLTPDTFAMAGLLLLMGLLPLYYAYVFHVMPYWRSSNFLHLGAQRPDVLLWTFGPIILLAVPRLAARANRPLVLWIAVTGLLMWSNLAQPGRLIAGLWLPFGVMAAQTLGSLRWSSLRTMGVCFLSISGLLLPLFFSDLIRAHAGRFPIFEPRGLVQVSHYLAVHTTARDVVQATFDDSNIIVGAAPAHVLAGHDYQTLDLAAAGNAQRHYFSASAAERQQIERRYHITYIVASEEQRPFLAQLAHDRRYVLAFADDNYYAYHVLGKQRGEAASWLATASAARPAYHTAHHQVLLYYLRLLYYLYTSMRHYAHPWHRGSLPAAL